MLVTYDGPRLTVLLPISHDEFDNWEFFLWFRPFLFFCGFSSSSTYYVLYQDGFNLQVVAGEKKVVLTSKIDQRKREMAVKNARNFVRDVNTRKICYSFCHLEMVEPLYYMQYYPVHRERSQAKLEDRAFFLHKIKANFFL